MDSEAERVGVMNSTIGKNTLAGDLLRGFVERLENLAAQKKQISQDEGVVREMIAQHLRWNENSEYPTIA